MKNAICLLFPYPLMLCGQIYEFSQAERQYLDELEMMDNTGNFMSKNDRVLDSEELAGLKAFIEQQLVTFTKDFLQMKDDNEIYITQSWTNKAKTNEFHPRHRHPNSVISGVMYLDDNQDESLPPIRFHRTLEMFPMEFEYKSLNESNASCRAFPAVQGQLLLFPSLLEHDVEKNESDRVRTSISFNTFVRGKVGHDRKLTAVDIA
ncbi:MAG: TIGR02466 family protein [Woeseiaceae bacterium]|nr:TIGR02466 family protein [Woeseiaceae bacterium]